MTVKREPESPYGVTVAHRYYPVTYQITVTGGTHHSSTHALMHSLMFCPSGSHAPRMLTAERRAPPIYLPTHLSLMVTVLLGRGPFML